MESLEAMLGAVWRASWQASVMVALVIGVQWIFRRRLTPRWRHALWFLVAARLVLPGLPESRVSVFNFAPRSGAVPQLRPLEGAANPAVLTQRLEAPVAEVAGTSATPVSARRPVRILPLVWLVGACALLFHVVLTSVRLFRKVQGLPVIADGPLAELLAKCKEEMNVHASIVLRESEAIGSPALCGIIRPSLLLPRGLNDRFTREEMRFVFLHELAHIQRRDILVNWLLTALQIVHWFNPVIWFAFARMRADRELACDDIALRHVGEAASRSYGSTIIRLLEEFSAPTAAPNLVGILEEKSLMRRRLAMIAGFNPSRRGIVLGFALLTALTVLALTDAETKDVSDAKFKGAVGVAAVKVSPRVRIGGVVESESGGAIEGAQVRIGPLSRTESIATEDVKTDGAGRWSVESFQEEDLTRIQIGVRKDGFAEYRLRVSREFLAALRDQSFRVQMSAGLQIFGFVRDTNGVPIKGARVFFNWRSFGASVGAPTDERGHYVLTDLHPGGASRVIAIADGFAQTTELIQDFQTSQQVDIKLEPGQTVRGRVVDADGKPVPKASIRVGNIRLPTAPPPVDWMGQTDDEGRFEWNGAPLQPQLYTISPRGAEGLDNESSLAVRIEPGEEKLIVLKRKQKIRGRVIDRQTHAPISRYSIATSRAQTPLENTYFAIDQEIADEKGEFEVALADSEQNALRVRAPGYYEKIVYKRADTEPNVIELASAKSIHGKVVDDEGRPLPGMKVAACYKNFTQTPTIERGRFANESYDQTVTSVTGANGTFTLSPSSEVSGLVTISGKGYADLLASEFTEPVTLVVKPFGRIEGTAYLGRKLATNYLVRAFWSSSRVEGAIRVHTAPGAYETRTDEQGHFVFEQVPPIQFAVMLIKESPGAQVTALSGQVVVPPGATAKMQLGGDGVQVHGRLRWSDNTDGDFSAYRRHGGLAGRMHFFAAEIEPNGVFTIPDVRPGKYYIQMNLYPLDAANDQSPRPLWMNKDVTIPESNGGSVELGDLFIDKRRN